jgi:hypothetical protein
VRGWRIAIERANLASHSHSAASSRPPFQSWPIGPTRPATAGTWVKSKFLNREEFVVVGWTDPEGSRQHIGALLLGYLHRGRRLALRGLRRHRHHGEGTEALAGVLTPLQVPKMPLAESPLGRAALAHRCSFPECAASGPRSWSR